MRVQNGQVVCRRAHTPDQPGGREESALSLVGNLADLELGDIFQIVSLSRRSGTLQLTTPLSSGEIVFKTGKVVAVFRTDHDQTVGEYLMQEGVISPTTFQEMLAAQRGGACGLDLFRSFEVSEVALEAALEGLLKRMVYAMFDWKEGTFSFVLEDQPDAWRRFALDSTRVVAEPGLNPQYLAIEGARLRDERGKDDTLDSFLSLDRAPKTPASPAADAASEAWPSDLGPAAGPDEVDFGSVGQSVGTAGNEMGDDAWLAARNPAHALAAAAPPGAPAMSLEPPASSTDHVSFAQWVNDSASAPPSEPSVADEVILFPGGFVCRDRAKETLAVAADPQLEVEPETQAEPKMGPGAAPQTEAEAGSGTDAFSEPDPAGRQPSQAAEAQSAVPAHGAPEPASCTAAAGGWRFLVVDDDPQVTGAVAASIAATGAAVETFGTVADVLGRLQGPFGGVVVVSDLIIARSDGRGILGGIEILERVRELSSDGPFVLFTDYQNKEAEARAQTLGVSAVLTKPRKAQIHVQGDTQTITPPMRGFLERLHAALVPYLAGNEAPRAPGPAPSPSQEQPAGGSSASASSVVAEPEPPESAPASSVAIESELQEPAPLSAPDGPSAEPPDGAPAAPLAAEPPAAGPTPVAHEPQGQEPPGTVTPAATDVPAMGDPAMGGPQGLAVADDRGPAPVGPAEHRSGPLPPEPPSAFEAVAPLAAASPGGNGLFDPRNEMRSDMEEALEPLAIDLPPAPISAGEMSFLRSMIAELRDPRSRDQVTLLVLRFAAAVVERAVLFLATRRAYVGLGGFSSDENTDRFVARVRTTQIPVEADSVFQKVTRFRTMVRTGLTQSEGNRKLVTGLGGTWPEGEVVAAPLISGDRVAAIVYGDNPSGRVLGPTEGLEIFLQQAGLVMERILLERRLEESQRRSHG